MKDFEQVLKRALRRCDPPESFAERVLARVAAEQQPIWDRVVSMWHRPMLRWAAVAAIVLSGAGELSHRAYEQQRLDEASGRTAAQQVMLALRITASKLRVAQKRVKSMEGEGRKVGKTL